MPSFSYKVIDADGKERKGNMNAPAKEHIEKRLMSEGLIIVDVDKEEMLDDGSLFGRGKLDDSDFAAFTRQLSHFLKAGIGVINSLRMMEEQSDNKKMQNAISYLIDQISVGDSLSLAMSNSDLFPEPLIAVVEASENTGRFTDNLDRMTKYFENCASRKDKIRKSIGYPIFMSFVVLFIILGVLLFVVPSFMGMLQDVDIVLPFSAKALIGVSMFLRSKWWLILFIAVVLCGLTVFAVKSKTGRIFLSRFRISYPGIGSRRIMCDCAEFAGLMSAVLYADIPMIKALELAAGEFSNHLLLKKAILNVKGQVASGSSLSQSMNAEIFPKLMINMLSIGEESGSLKEMFDNAADYYEEQFESAIRKSAMVTEVVLVVSLAVVLGIVVMALLKPLLALYEAVGSM